MLGDRNDVGPSGLERPPDKKFQSGDDLNSNNNNSAQKYQDNNNIEYRGDGIEIETQFEQCLRNKFSLFKAMITRTLF